MFLYLKTKWRFGTKSALFECRNFVNAYFSNSIFCNSDFLQECSFLALLMVIKGAGRSASEKHENYQGDNYKINFIKINQCIHAAQYKFIHNCNPVQLMPFVKEKYCFNLLKYETAVQRFVDAPGQQINSHAPPPL